jgi:DNA excision repair protein ERCC-2
MTEEEKSQFLQEFNQRHKDGLVGFAVMGGMFGEGIDLVRESLLGAIIVGVGLPQICFERNIIRDHFQRENGEGFEYAYVYPGMNKVMQAAGRVIRTTTDKGVVLLIDDRFARANYKKLFPSEWKGFKRGNEKGIEKIIGDFWNNSEY